MPLDPADRCRPVPAADLPGAVAVLFDQSTETLGDLWALERLLLALACEVVGRAADPLAALDRLRLRAQGPLREETGGPSEKLAHEALERMLTTIEAVATTAKR